MVFSLQERKSEVYLHYSNSVADMLLWSPEVCCQDGIDYKEIQFVTGCFTERSNTHKVKLCRDWGHNPVSWQYVWPGCIDKASICMACFLIKLFIKVTYWA